MNVEISVVTALFNKQPYVAETVQSIQAQSIDNWEMIIVDDGSTDSSVEVVQEFRDPRIRLVRCEARGPGAARNLGIQLAAGEWIQFLDADDLLEPDHFERQLAAASEHGDADVVACEWQEFRDGEANPRVIKTPTGLGEAPEKLRDSAIAFTPWVVHAALVRRRILTRNYLWPEQLDRLLGEDIVFWFHLILDHRVSYGDSRGPLYRRMTPNSRTDFTPVRWFGGLHAAASKNVERAGKLSPGQCESLMRLYMGIYELAHRAGCADIKRRSMEEAARWLQEYMAKSERRSLPMILRGLIGLHNFCHFSRVLSRGQREYLG